VLTDGGYDRSPDSPKAVLRPGKGPCPPPDRSNGAFATEGDDFGCFGFLVSLPQRYCEQSTSFRTRSVAVRGSAARLSDCYPAFACHWVLEERGLPPAGHLLASAPHCAHALTPA
jgi:hypothetical protein